MKNDKKHPVDLMNERLEEIKNGKVFDVPADYFQRLEQELFVNRRSEFMPLSSSAGLKARVLSLRPLTYAASFLILIGLVWWMWKGTDKNGSGFAEKFVPEYVLEQYLETEIMELDLEYLLQDLTDEDLQVLSDGIMLPFESLDAYFEESEEFMY